MHKHIELQHDAFFYHLFELISKFCVCSFYDANKAHKIEEISLLFFVYNFEYYNYAMHQPINSRSRAQESFPAPPRRPERNDQTYEPYRANGNAPRSSNQWGERQYANI
jgi:hypothetical protein